MNLISPASTNPSGVTMDEIIRDAANCASAGITGIGTAINAGMNLYNTMGNIFANPQAFAQPSQNPYMADMYSANVPQCSYAYAENGMGNNVPFLNTMNPQPTGGYPGFADPTYCTLLPSTGFGYGGNF